MIRNVCACLPNCKNKLRLRFLFLAWAHCRKRELLIFETSFSNTPSTLRNLFANHEKECIRNYETQTEFSLWLSFSTPIIGEEKVQVEKNIEFTKFSFFSASLRTCLVFLVEVLKLKFRYDFVDNLMALLLKKESVRGDPRNRS